MKKNLLALILLLSLTLTLTACGSSNTGSSGGSTGASGVGSGVNIPDEPQVKKSTSGICHGKGTTYYNRTTNFIPFDSIQECLNSGGRLPKK